MDVRYFQAQLCALVNFLHLVWPEDMSPKSLLAKEVCEALPAHGFWEPDLYPEKDYMIPTTRDMKVRETYHDAQCVVFSKKIFFLVLMSQYRRIKL